MDTIRHYAKFPATGVSLRQMVQFGEKPSVGKYQSPGRQLTCFHFCYILIYIFLELVC